MGNDSDNIAYQAAQALQKRGCRLGAAIEIDKRIPVAAGLGGGSSDAAAVLVALNDLWGCGLDQRELAGIAAGIGADVPFFIYGGAARVRGIGEIIEPLTPLDDVPVLLIPFASGLATADVYRAFDESGALGQAAVEPALRALAAGDVVALGRAVANDLEPVVVHRRPEVAEARRDLLAHGSVGAGMSGSGPTVFGLFATFAEALTAYRRLRHRWPQIGLYRLCGKE